MKKKVFLGLGIFSMIAVYVCLTIIFCHIAISALPWGLMWGYSNRHEELDEPQFKYGEFPFKIVYETDGEVITIEDTLVVEYAGIEYDDANFKKKHRWNQYFMSQQNLSDQERSMAFQLSLYRESSYNIFFVLGSSEYYMGLPEEDFYYRFYQIVPGDIVISNGSRVLSEEELLEDYGIKIIEKYISPPITSK